VAELTRIGAAAVMGVDAAHPAEIVLGHVGVELVAPQVLASAHDFQPVFGHAGGDGAAPAAHRAVAAARIDDAIGQVQAQFDRAAVAGGGVPFAYRRAGNKGDAHGDAPCKVTPT